MFGLSTRPEFGEGKDAVRVASQEGDQRRPERRPAFVATRLAAGVALSYGYDATWQRARTRLIGLDLVERPDQRRKRLGCWIPVRI